MIRAWLVNDGAACRVSSKTISAVAATRTTAASTPVAMIQPRFAGSRGVTVTDVACAGVPCGGVDDPDAPAASGNPEGRTPLGKTVAAVGFERMKADRTS